MFWIVDSFNKYLNHVKDLGYVLWNCSSELFIDNLLLSSWICRKYQNSSLVFINLNALFKSITNSVLYTYIKI